MGRFLSAILAVAFAVSLNSSFAFAASNTIAGPKTMAKQCRDAKGKFTKCPPKVSKMAPKPKCRDKMGKFVKCK
jgi:hypothetical protein